MSVVHPSAPSNINVGQKPLGCARQREHAKRMKYDNIARGENADFVPFVLESSGAMGSAASELIQVVVLDRPFLPGEFASPKGASGYLRLALAVLLQRRNARIVRQGIQMAQHRAPPPNVARLLTAHLPPPQSPRPETSDSGSDELSS